MEQQENIFLLKGKVQHYDWGGIDYLPELLQFENNGKQPCAEYWMGAHASAPSILICNSEERPLNELIKNDPGKFIGKKVQERFGELPYLLKILDVKKMLSIQVHPTKSEAEKGFDAEEKKGTPVNAANRNYKDRNHKPEVMIALSEFWLLHGFKTEEKIAQVLNEVEAFHPLQNIFKEKGTKGLYQHVMEMPQNEVNTMLLPLVKNILSNKSSDKSKPEYWIQKLFAENKSKEPGDLDKGIFSIYFFNIVKAEKGEAIFQGAGLPHAYLEGQNVELMANSDNVLRGGLTSKYVDVPELLKHTSFEGIVPKALQPELNKNEKIFNCPVPDFGISEITLGENETIQLQTGSLEILFVLEGDITVESGSKKIDAKRGEAIAVLPASDFRITSKTGNSVVYKAFVP